MKISLKNRLIITFFIFISVPMGILGFRSYIMASNTIQDSVKQQLKNNTSDTGALIQKAIESVKDSLEISSLNTELGKVAQNLNEADMDATFQYIQNVQQSKKDFMEVLIITDANGKVVIDSETKEPDIDLSDRDYMKKALSTGKEEISEVLTSRFTGNPAIFVVNPIKEGGKIIGTLVGSIRFDSISKYASRIRCGEKGYSYMIDTNGLFVYHKDKSKILKENIADIKSEELKSIINEMKEGKTSEGFYNDGNGDKYVVFQPVDKWIIAGTADYDEYMETAINIRNNTIIISLISVIIAMVCAYLFSTKRIINPIKKLEGLMKRAGEGDLTVNANINSNDEFEELGNYFDDMIKHQDHMVKNVINAAEQLNAASEEMASSSEEISAATEEISASITQVAEDSDNQNKSIVAASEVLVQLSSLVQLAQNRAKVTSLNTADTMKVADFGRKKVEETVNAINTISSGSAEAAQVLERLNNLSVRANGITSTINSIAEQTNLLALNAAIEAASAGEHGRGFSVVAEEVRKLSEESNEKAKEISTLINEMIEQTQDAVNTMEKAKEEVNNGVAIVSETDRAFVNIINSIEGMAGHVNEILDITGDEVASSDKVITLINEMATVTESNAANSENVSSAAEEQAKAIECLTATAEETSAMSEELATLVERFKI